MKTFSEYIVSEAKVTTTQLMHEFVTSGKSTFDWTDREDVIDFLFALTSYCEENSIEDELTSAIFSATGKTVEFRTLTTAHGWDNIMSSYPNIKKLVQKVELIVTNISTFKDDERMLVELLDEYTK